MQAVVGYLTLCHRRFLHVSIRCDDETENHPSFRPVLPRQELLVTPAYRVMWRRITTLIACFGRRPRSVLDRGKRRSTGSAPHRSSPRSATTPRCSSALQACRRQTQHPLVETVRAGRRIPASSGSPRTLGREPMNTFVPLMGDMHMTKKNIAPERREPTTEPRPRAGATGNGGVRRRTRRITPAPLVESAIHQFRHHSP